MALRETMKSLATGCCGWMDECCRAVLTDASLLVLRVGLGCTMLFGHGLPKLLSWGEMAADFEQMGVRFLAD